MFRTTGAAVILVIVACVLQVTQGKKYYSKESRESSQFDSDQQQDFQQLYQNQYDQQQSYDRSDKFDSGESESQEYVVFKKRTELRPGEYIGRGHELVSNNGHWHLLVQNNQRIILYKSSPRIGIVQAWSIHEPGLKKLIMTSKGRLRICAGKCGRGKSSYLSRKVCKCRNDARLILKNNGILAIYSCGKLRWTLKLHCKDVVCPKHYHCEKKKSGAVCCKKDKGPASNSTSVEDKPSKSSEETKESSEETKESEEEQKQSSGGSSSEEGNQYSGALKTAYKLIQKLNEKLGDLWDKQKWSDIKSMYHKDAVFSIAGKTLEGPDDIHDFFKSSKQMEEWANGSTSVVQKIIPCKTVVSLHGVFNYTHSGKHIVVPFINVWTRDADDSNESDNWKLQYDFESDTYRP